MIAHIKEFFRYLPILLKKDTIVLRRIASALGDNLFLSFLSREIKAVSPHTTIAIETKWPDLFDGNPHIDVVLKEKVAIKYYKPRYILNAQTTEHMMDQMIRQLPFPIKKWDRKVDFFFKENEFDTLSEQLPESYIVFNPRGKKTHSANRKEWGEKNFQQVRDLLPENPFVQIGPCEIPLLENVLDFRGTCIRESAFIIQQSLTGVFLEGGLTHLANAVDRPSVIIYGGALSPSVSGYAMHENLYIRTHCSPCICSHRKMTDCDTMVCMKQIHPRQVVESVKRLSKKVEGARTIAN